MAHSAAARKLRRELDAELARNAAQAGTELVWTAADRAVLERISATVDHIGDLSRDYEAADDAKTRVKLSSEIRLLDGLLARLLKQVRTEAPQPESLRTIKARRAAAVRWSRDAGA